MRTRAPIAMLMSGLCVHVPFAWSQAGGGLTSDRGYVEQNRGLVSKGAQASTSSGAFTGVGGEGAKEAAASARGRASAKSAGLQPQVAEGLKAETFQSPDAAVQAFIGALRAGDSARLEQIFAAQKELISSGDVTADRALKERFLREYDQKHSLAGAETGMGTLSVGQSNWPFAVPIVLGDQGYYFNAAAGATEVVYRRIGRNELAAIDVCRGFVAAQKDYATVGHDGLPEGLYAQKLMSDKGKQNGLYWPVPAAGLRSPGGPLLAQASDEGYSADTAGRSVPYHGYLYRPLMAQGKNAQGGAKNYVSDGRQSGGFALVAYPAEYGRSGVMSFIVNQDSVVYQKDLGKDTASVAREMREFDPKGWSPAT